MVEKNKKTEGKSVWRDKQKFGKFIEYFMIFLLIIVFLFSSLIDMGSFGSWGGLVIAIFFSSILVFSLFKKTSSIKIGGVSTGNIIHGELLSIIFSLKQKNTFLRWRDIKNIKIIDKEYSSKFIMNSAPFIVITTKDKKEYECIVYDKEGFIQALKKVNKYHLLSKDSKYR